MTSRLLDLNSHSRSEFSGTIGVVIRVHLYIDRIRFNRGQYPHLHISGDVKEASNRRVVMNQSTLHPFGPAVENNGQSWRTLVKGVNTSPGSYAHSSVARFANYLILSWDQGDGGMVSGWGCPYKYGFVLIEIRFFKR